MTHSDEYVKKLERIVARANALLSIWAEFDGDPVCCGVYFDGLSDALDALTDEEMFQAKYGEPPLQRGAE